MPSAPPEDSSTSLYEQDSYRPTPPPEPQPSQNPYQSTWEAGANHISPPSRSQMPLSNYEPPLSAYQPPSSSYEPPTSTTDPTTSGYEPPSVSAYEPPSYAPDAQASQIATDSPEEERPKKRSIMDDEDADDFTARAAAMLKQEKAQKDRAADEAFQKAAEADGQSHLIASTLASY